MSLNVGLLIGFHENYCIVKYDILHYYGFRDMKITPTFFLNFHTPEYDHMYKILWLIYVLCKQNC